MKKDLQAWPTDNEVADAIKSVPAHYAFIQGYSRGVKWTPTGGQQATLNITKHDWQEQVDKLDVTHSGSVGIQMLLAGILRGTGNVEANQDDSQIVFNATVAIYSGAKGVMLFYGFAAAGNPFQVPGMIQTVTQSSVVSGLVTYKFSIELDGISGTFVRPS